MAFKNSFVLVVLAAQKALKADKIPVQELGAARLTIASVIIESRKYSHCKKNY